MEHALPDRLETPRLFLRQPRPADAARIFASYTQDMAVARYMIWRPHTSPSDSESFIADCIRDWALGERKAYVLALRGLEHEPIGMLDARAIGTTVDIGYVLAPTHWGRGLMPEAIRAFTDEILSSQQHFRTQATCDVDNLPSARTLEKAGFVREGRLERFSMHPNIDSTPRACFMYARCR